MEATSRLKVRSKSTFSDVQAMRRNGAETERRRSCGGDLGGSTRPSNSLRLKVFVLNAFVYLNGIQKAHTMSWAFRRADARWRIFLFIGCRSQTQKSFFSLQSRALHWIIKPTKLNGSYNRLDSSRLAPHCGEPRTQESIYLLWSRSPLVAPPAGFLQRCLHAGSWATVSRRGSKKNKKKVNKRQRVFL